MNDTPDNLARENGSEVERDAGHAASLAESDDWVKLARHYFAGEFHRLDRQDCPDRAQLESKARSGSLPDDTLRAHLFSCSDCFQAYRTAMDTRPVQVFEPSISRWTTWLSVFTLRPSLAFVGSAAALVCAVAFIGGYWRWQHGQTSSPKTDLPKVSILPSSDGGTTSSGQLPNDTLSSASSPSRPSAEDKTLKTESMVALNVDLNGYVALRDVAAESGSQPEITLPAQLVRLHLRLPEGSASGRYSVRVIGGSNKKTINATPAKSKDGKRLTVVLDLRNAEVGKARLELQCAGESAESYYVKIQP